MLGTLLTQDPQQPSGPRQSGLRVDLCGPFSAVKWLVAPFRTTLPGSKRREHIEDGPWVQCTHKYVLMRLYMKRCV